MNAQSEWFDSVNRQNPDYAKEIQKSLASDNQMSWVVSRIIDLYQQQNDAIGEYARRRGLEHLYLAELEHIWMDDPDGEERFFEEFRTSHPDEWERLNSSLDLYSFMIFQIAWLFSPVHAYLVSMSHNGQVSTDDLYGDRDAYNRLRARFRPFSSRLLQ